MDGGADGWPLFSTSPAGGAGRGPLCALALLRAGREDRGALKRRLEIFAEHAATLGAERGKGLMHTGADAQGSHYILYDWATAAEAAAELPPEEAARYRRVIVDQLLACRTDDGAFLDNPILGRDLGAALALRAFAFLPGRPEPGH
jgi:hypothetical protein